MKNQQPKNPGDSGVAEDGRSQSGFAGEVFPAEEGVPLF